MNLIHKQVHANCSQRAGSAPLSPPDQFQNGSPPVRVVAVLFVGLFLLAAGSAVAATNETQYLSGTDKDHTVPWEFRVSAGRNSGFWTNIPVPSCWDTKGFGSYEYGNDSTTEFGEYRHSFSVPNSWTNKRVFLVYEGSMTDTETKLNGNPPGVAPPSIPLSNERAFNNSTTASSGQAGGLAASTAGNTLNLGTLTAFTFTGWIKPDGDFSAIPNARFPRLISVGATTGYDGGTTNGAFLILFHSSPTTRALQFKVHADAGNGALSSANVLNGSDWTFVAVTYDSALATDQVKFFVGTKAASLGNAVSTLTYPRGAVQFGSDAYAYLLNRNARDRAFDGWGDDFRIFAGALTPAQLETVRFSGLTTNSTPPAALYQWNFNTAASGTTVAPNVGSGGTLTLLNSSGMATDLYSAIGGGLSSGGSAGTALHQGSFYEFSYEVTSNLNYGASNLLEVTVRKKSANTSINQAERQADYWTFGGIYRPVYLEARPRAHIERVAVDAKADGQIAVRAFLDGVTSASVVTARVTDTNNIPLGVEFTNAIAAGASNVLLSAALPAPQPWSPEFPNLYQLTVELRDGANVLHSRTETIGFRTVSFVTNSGFYLNGKKFMMRGANRHEFWPSSGRTTSRALSIADIELMKSMNMNAVRMSHYPPAKHFLEECDRLGMLVLDELAGWQSPPYDDVIAPGLVREMVIRDVNHPCIFAWANGNEGGFNFTVDDDYALWDPQNRRVLHPANWESETTGAVRTHHYATYTQVTNYLGAGKMVFMPTEIQHGLFDGGGGAGLEDHWNAMRAAPNSAGMFIWALLDEGLVRDDQGGVIDVAGDAAPDGIVGPHREKEASYYAVKALWSPVQITAPNPATFNGQLAVENRFDLTDLNQCTFRWQLGWFPDPTDPTNKLNAGFLTAVDSGDFAGPAVAPGAAGLLTLPNLPAGALNNDALRCIAKDPFGREIYTWTWPLHGADRVCERVTRVVGTNAFALFAAVNGSELSVTNGTRVWRFDLGSGRLNGVRVGNQPLSLANGPRPVAGTWSATNISHGFDNGDYVVTVNNLTTAADGFQWRIRSNGWARLNYRYTLTGTQSWLGITFDYPETNVTAMRWLGQGPYRVWKNRLVGQEVAVHYKATNNTDTGKQWGYPEFRGYHGQFHWAALDTAQPRLTLATPTSNLFLRVLTPPVASVSRPGVSPSFPSGNLSVLHAINAIGNKFALPDASVTGPSSANVTATGVYTGEVDFFVGDLPETETDRDGNGLSDAWEFKFFNDLGQNPFADPDGDGLKLMLENAFDLSPLVPDANSPRLPRPIVPGADSPAAMGYRVPLAQLSEFHFIPEISGDLITWFNAEEQPGYFSIQSSLVGDDMQFAVERGPGWAGGTNQVFLRLRIERT